MNENKHVPGGRGQGGIGREHFVEDAGNEEQKAPAQQQVSTPDQQEGAMQNGTVGRDWEHNPAQDSPEKTEQHG